MPYKYICKDGGLGKNYPTNKSVDPTNIPYK